MSVGVLLEWWNLVFVIPFGLGFLFLLLQIMGMGDHDADADHDAAGRPYFEHDSGEHDGVGDSESLLWKAALLLGVGRVPVSILLMSLCFLWGAFGYSFNLVLQPFLRTPFLFFPLSLVLSAVLTFFLTGLMSRGISRIIPKTTTHYSKMEDFVGKTAQALYLMAPGKTGTIRIYDAQGNLQQFKAVLTTEDAVPGGTELLITGYLKADDIFKVEPLPEEMKRLT